MRCPHGAYFKQRSGYPASPKTVGEAIRKRRLDLNLRQLDAAKIIGCDKLTVVNWEKGHTQPALCHMAGIVEFLGFDPLPGGDDLAGNLLHHRKSRGMCQKQFAAQIGVDPGTFARWERQERFPDEKQLVRLGQAGFRMGNASGIR